MSFLGSNSQRHLINRFLDNPVCSSAEVDGNDSTAEALVDNSNQSPIESTCYHDLQFIEQRFLDYQRSPFNTAELQFQSHTPPTQASSEPDLDTLLGLLPPVLPSTKQFSYCLRGYRSLIATLNTMECPTEVLEARRSNLLSAISVELETLRLTVDAERQSQLTMDAHHEGLRHIHFGMTTLPPLLI